MVLDRPFLSLKCYCEVTLRVNFLQNLPIETPNFVYCAEIETRNPTLWSSQHTNERLRFCSPGTSTENNLQIINLFRH